MECSVNFAGGMVIETTIGNHVIRTDQLQKDGGQDSSPSPFDLFLASIVTCSGYYALEFCLERDIPSDGLAVSMTTSRDPEIPMIDLITIEVKLPKGFPEKYEKALTKAVELCTVKKHLITPPDFETVLTR